MGRTARREWPRLVPVMSVAGMAVSPMLEEASHHATAGMLHLVLQCFHDTPDAVAFSKGRRWWRRGRWHGDTHLLEDGHLLELDHFFKLVSLDAKSFELCQLGIELAI